MEKRARVIILGGQSNATGQSYISCLKQNADMKLVDEYMRGYPNVLINYAVDNYSNTSEGEFVPVTLGQGATAEQFGPEVGLASYLNRFYPQEVFYIIKSTWSGTGIAQNWQPENEQYAVLLDVMTEALATLNKQGFEVDISAFCWMQGETDAMTKEFADNYYNLQAELMQRLFSEFSNYATVENCVFVDAGISDSQAWTYGSTVNAEKIRYAAESKKRVYLDTQAAGLTYDKDEVVDYIHYDAIPCVRLGEMFGEAVARGVFGNEGEETL